MKRLFTETFNGFDVHSMIWNNSACWFATEIASFLDYTETSKAIMTCIEVERFRIGKEYEVLTGVELKRFKAIAGDSLGKSFKFAPRVIIFYEPGLYGFLAYTEKPLGVTFRTWIREEVVPQIRATGAYILDDEYYDKTYNSDIEFICLKDNEIAKEEKVSAKVITRSSKVSKGDKNLVEKIADNVIIFDKYLESLSIADEDKFLFLISLYKSANIEVDLGFINSNSSKLI
ncbi:MAG: BRO family protein [Sarcina sp.]